MNYRMSFRDCREVRRRRRNLRIRVVVVAGLILVIMGSLVWLVTQ